MTRLSKLIAIATAASAMGFTANAEDRFETTIEYAPGASAETLYQDISKQVARACRKELRRNGRPHLAISSRFMSGCQEELMTNAVRGINDPILTAYFNGNQKLVLQLASR